MRPWMVFPIGLLAVVLVLLFSEPIRRQAQDVVFGKRAAGSTPAAAPASPAPAAAVAPEPAAVPEPEATAAPAAPPEPVQAPATALADASAAPAVSLPEPPQEQALPAAPEPEEAPSATSVEAAAPPVAPAQSPPPQQQPQTAPVPQGAGMPFRIQPPPVLAAVNFGMSSAQVAEAYPIAWQRQERGEVMLANYPVPDKSQMIRFHFAGDALYLIEIRAKPQEGETIQALYDRVQAQCAQQYSGAPDSSLTRWSDGIVVAAIQRIGDSVELSYLCPSAKR